MLRSIIGDHANIEFVAYPKAENFDTMQFHLVGMTTPQAEAFLDVAKHEGLPMQIFGIGRNARDYRSWTYVDAHRDDCP